MRRKVYGNLMIATALTVVLGTAPVTALQQMLKIQQ